MSRPTFALVSLVTLLCLGGLAGGPGAQVLAPGELDLVSVADGAYRVERVEVPGALVTDLYGIDASGRLVGSYRAADLKVHGLLVTDGTFVTVDFAGATLTRLGASHPAACSPGATARRRPERSCSGARCRFPSRCPAAASQVTWAT